MKRARRTSLQRHTRHIPKVMYFAELIIGVVIIASAQGLWATLAGAAPDITPPSIPANLSVTGRSANSIDLSWDASTDDVAVTGYHVYQNGSLVATPVVTNYTASSLTPNTAYTYTVSAFDAQTNESSQSAPAPTSTLVDNIAPTTPNNLHQTGSTTSTISFAWNASSDNVGVTGYEIYRNGILIRTQAGTTYTDTGLAVYTSYIYTITAHDSTSNTSPLSAPLYGGTAADITPPSVPDNLHKTGSTVNSISLAWNASSDDVGVTGYHLYRDGVLITSPGGTTYTDTGLNVSSNYRYTVSAYDATSNTSAVSAPYDTTSSNDVTPPVVPTGVHTTSVLDTSISLAWNASSDDVATTGYKIYRDAVLIGTSPTTNFTDVGLNPVTDYDYSIAAYDAANNTSLTSSPLATQTAYDTTDPSKPANLHTTTRTDTSISLAWNASTDNNAVSGYDVFRDNVLIISTSNTSYTDSALAVATDYSYQVRAHDASGNDSVKSDQLDTSTLPDLIAPANPTGLASLDQTTTTIDLSWTAATDDVAVTGYRIYRDSVQVGTTAGATTYTDTGLHYNHSYSYTVTAVDNATNQSAPSAALGVSTEPDTTPPVVHLTAPTNGQTVQFTIPISATASDDLDLNRVEFYVDSTLISSHTSAPFALNWNSYAVHNGAHTITAKAIDASGNFTTSSATINETNPPPPLVGDLNGDHKVNIFDLSVMLSRWNKSGAGDFNSNGKVDIFDLSVLLSRYGQDNSGYN